MPLPPAHAGSEIPARDGSETRTGVPQAYSRAAPLGNPPAPSGELSGKEWSSSQPARTAEEEGEG